MRSRTDILEARMEQAPVRLEGVRKAALDRGRARLFVAGFFFAMLFCALGARAIELSVLGGHREPRLVYEPAARDFTAARADILDRNGVVLATSLPTASLYADPRDLRAGREDPNEAAVLLAEILPGLDVGKTAQRLGSDRSFVYLRRDLTPAQQNAVNRLGITGLYFQREDHRVYPQGGLLSQVVGLTDVDGNGIAGIEKRFDAALRSGQAVHLSLDARFQTIVIEALQQAVDAFNAIGAAGLVMDVHTGEILAMVSLPDFDPNKPMEMTSDTAFNRAALGVYEMGSVFKLFNTAMALDSGKVRLKSGYDATKPIKIARFSIRDLHPENRWLSVPEILVHSSNIGSAKMALDLGTKTQQKYLRRLGMLTPAAIELPEVGHPLYPKTWREINTMTISYGHGIAVSPLQTITGVSALVNGGILRPPTLLRRDPDDIGGERVLSKETSRWMRGLMRLVVTHGTGRNADVPGYLVGGKTGTAEKVGYGGYKRKALISSFVAAFPTDAPRYAILVSVDEPKGNERSHGYATAGWVAAPAVKQIVARIGALTGIAPTRQDAAPPKPGDPLFIQVKGRG
ncbi:MAG: peptidoglycan D,D-transpeptidase FtsI family protein [Magnetospiraceae bacterium]